MKEVPERIVLAVADTVLRDYGITLEQIRGRRRTALISAARHEMIRRLYARGLTAKQAAQACGRTVSQGTYAINATYRERRKEEKRDAWRTSATYRQRIKDNQQRYRAQQRLLREQNPRPAPPWRPSPLSMRTWKLLGMGYSRSAIATAEGVSREAIRHRIGRLCGHVGLRWGDEAILAQMWRDGSYRSYCDGSRNGEIAA